MKGNKFSYILFFLMLLTGFAARAQQALLRADRDSIRYGERVRLHLQVEDVKQGDSILVIPRVGDLEMVKQTGWDTLRKGNRLTLGRDWFITGWDAGKYTVPAWQVRVGDTLIQTDSLHIRVADMKVDSLQPAWLTPKEAVNPGRPEHPVHLGHGLSLMTWLIILWLLALIIVVGAVLYVIRKSGAEPETNQMAYARSVSAWEALQAGKDLIDDANSFYTRLTDILRDYMERALGIPAKERVSALLINELDDFRFEDGSRFPRELLTSLREMFRRADLAKFAKFSPSIPQRDADLDTAKSFLDFARNVLDKIEARKREEREALRREQMRRNRKRNAVIITLFLILFLPTAFFVVKGMEKYLEATQSRWVWKLYDIPQPKDWYALNYGPAPSLVFHSPVVPKAVDLPDSLHAHYPDLAVLTGRLKGTELVVLTATAKPREKVDVAGILQAALPQSELTMHSAQWLTDASGKIRKVKDSRGHNWWIRFWQNGNQVRLLAVGARAKGPAGQMAGLVAGSARLVEPQNKTQ